MGNLNNSVQSNTKLRVSFPKSSEDHRLQLVKVNDSVFAIVHSALESDGPINLHCDEWSLILLAPIKSKVDVVISGINVIYFSEIESKEGTVNIHASNRLVKLSSSSKPSEKVCEAGKKGEFRFDDDLGTFLHFFRLFNSVVSSVHTGTEDSFLDAQKKIIEGLCVLAGKIERKTENLTLDRILGIWDILSLES